MVRLVPEETPLAEVSNTVRLAYVGVALYLSRFDSSYIKPYIFRNGDKFLINTYHTLALPAGATPGASVAGQFIDFVSSTNGQKIIGDFGKELYGEGLYNDAAYAKKYDD
jgi:ABC-type tungstate transport system permease subunit